ncbi:MAG TPA: hypothetical protein VKM55_31020 [Candidatus Lokiarchaeia archaeon]|nr:hypothetical protein [Candidatus Lokiarchaeia archaeon]
MGKNAKVERQDMEHSTQNPGESIPDDMTQSIMRKCRRRCCMCWGIRGDKSEKDGQIAHLDRDRANNDEDNLVFLCRSCYDFFDKGRNSSRGYTSSYVRFNRDGLYEKLGVATIVNKPEAKELYPEEQSVLVDFEEQLGEAIPNVTKISPIQSGFVAMDGHLVQLQIHKQIASIP